MPGDLEPHDDRARLRASDAERHAVAERLREAAGEGRLDLEELEQRLEAVYAARTRGDLVPLTADLPGAAPASAPVPAGRPVVRRQPDGTPAARHHASVAVMSGSNRRGVWEVAERHTAVAVMGGVVLDLRRAVLAAPETTIVAVAFWGGIDVVVDARTRVVVEGVGIMGSFSQLPDEVEPDLAPDAPVVRVTGVALMAGVTVRRRASDDDPPRPSLPHGH